MASVGLQGTGLNTTTEKDTRRFTATVDGGLPDSNNNQGEKDDLYTELWHACAGPHVYVPRTGERVFYFPQGHMEQVEAYANQDGRTEMPIYNLPSRILCKVVCVQLKAEAHSDEVFAQITLLPLIEQDEKSLEDENALPLPQQTNSYSFSKTLTPSDTSTHGGFSFPKRYADECLPPLDMLQQPPLQELVAVDLHGFQWHFRHIYRGQPKRHLLTSGWSTFVTSKKIVAGDACIFLRGENGELRVGIRRAMATQNNASTSVISGHSMQHGILASAFHAISTGTMFTVYYRPWTSPAEYIIPFDKYMKSAENDYFVGTRFRIHCEGEESAEKRSAGTIIGIEDHDCIRWPSSEWRRLKVQWDTASDTERLSPWNIEPIDPANKNDTFVLPQPKRARALDLSSTGFSNLARKGLLLNSVKYTPQRRKEVLQGQEISDVHVHEPGAQTPSLVPQLVPTSNPNLNRTQLRLDNQLYFPMQNPFYHCAGSAIAFPGENVVTSSLTNQWPPIFATYSKAFDNVAYSRSFSVSNVNSSNSGSQESMMFKPRSEDETLLAQPNGCGRCMVFGVNLVSHPELPSPQVATSSELNSPYSVPPITHSSVSETIQVSETSKSEKQCKKCCTVSNRSCTKVLKYGTALGRSVDLTRFDGYDDLISKLDLMFDFKGSLKNGSSGWQISYMDDEGDMMLIGDYEWEKFCSVVRRMFICPKEEIDKLKPGSPFPASV